MATPIRVFICHKKMLAEMEDRRAEILHYILKQRSEQFTPWVDTSKLEAGVRWETEIYTNILDSDVLLVLIGPGTSKSPWVQREIALATAFGIEIVPLGSDLSASELTDELKALDIAGIQGKLTQNLRLGKDDALISEIGTDLANAAQRTKERVSKKLSGLLNRRTPPEPKADDEQYAASFVLQFGGHTINLHIASGDLSKVSKIDALVNSENDYMQMARVFESRTVSSMLRRLGSHSDRYEDTIQQELDEHLKGYSRPLQAGQVFATSAGGPDSELAKVNKAKYILHVAAVQAVAAENRVTPFRQPDQISRCVRNCLTKVTAINAQNGVISPTNSPQYKEQELRAAAREPAIRSIIFPLFGTGQGGTETAQVLTPMMDAIESYLGDEDNVVLTRTLTDIYISAFKQRDLEALTAFLKARLG
jgi:O-acetyl-ADP-ribose deacetylase (regulator of RNase III)